MYILHDTKCNPAKIRTIFNIAQYIFSINIKKKKTCNFNKQFPYVLRVIFIKVPTEAHAEQNLKMESKILVSFFLNYTNLYSSTDLVSSGLECFRFGIQYEGLFDRTRVLHPTLRNTGSRKNP